MERYEDFHFSGRWVTPNLQQFKQQHYSQQTSDHPRMNTYGQVRKDSLVCLNTRIHREWQRRVDVDPGIESTFLYQMVETLKVYL